MNVVMDTNVVVSGWHEIDVMKPRQFVEQYLVTSD